jgi:Zn-dependent protease with chaperone function
VSWFDLVYALVKSPFANLWPLLFLPAAAGAICEFAARRLPATRADWRLAAALAAAPGLLFLALTAIILWRIATHPHWDQAWQHVVKYQLTAGVAVLILGRAAWRAWQRKAVLAQLLRLAVPAEGRLGKAAARARVRAYLLPCSEPECFVAGVVSPAVYISAGALGRLSDGELAAALRHERAHIRGHDTAMLAFLSFLADLSLSGRSALTAYHQSRERIADEAAVQAGGPIDLASALLALAHSPVRPIPAIGIAGTAPAAWRLHAILGNEPSRSAPRFARVAALAGLGVSASFAAWPTLQLYIIDLLCPCHL